jgi:hypothetical protein
MFLKRNKMCKKGKKGILVKRKKYLAIRLYMKLQGVSADSLREIEEDQGHESLEESDLRTSHKSSSPFNDAIRNRLQTPKILKLFSGMESSDFSPATMLSQIASSSKRAVSSARLTANAVATSLSMRSSRMGSVRIPHTESAPPTPLPMDFSDHFPSSISVHSSPHSSIHISNHAHFSSRSHALIHPSCHTPTSASPSATPSGYTSGPYSPYSTAAAPVECHLRDLCGRDRAYSTGDGDGDGDGDIERYSDRYNDRYSERYNDRIKDLHMNINMDSDKDKDTDRDRDIQCDGERHKDRARGCDRGSDTDRGKYKDRERDNDDSISADNSLSISLPRSCATSDSIPKALLNPDSIDVSPLSISVSISPTMSFKPSPAPSPSISTRILASSSVSSLSLSVSLSPTHRSNASRPPSPRGLRFSPPTTPIASPVASICASEHSYLSLPTRLL